MRSGSNKAGQLVGWALGYAEKGWPVLPLIPGQKRPLTQNGLLDASVDTYQLTDWWTRWPFANIGLRTGVQFDVLDVDGDEGRASIAAKTGPGFRHPGPVSRTGKGEHWLYLPGGTANRAGLLTKVDWRGTNGYIVAPPSIHPDGYPYAWDPDNGPDLDLPAVPEWLAPLLDQWTEPLPRPTAVRADPNTIGIVDIAEKMGLDPRRDGRVYAIACPFHDGDRDPSLKLYEDNNTFYCFGCSAWGTMFDLHDMRPRYKHAPS